LGRGPKAPFPQDGPLPSFTRLEGEGGRTMSYCVVRCWCCTTPCTTLYDASYIPDASGPDALYDAPTRRTMHFRQHSKVQVQFPEPNAHYSQSHVSSNTCIPGCYTCSPQTHQGHARQYQRWHGWTGRVSPSPCSSLLLCNTTQRCTVCDPPTGRCTG